MITADLHTHTHYSHGVGSVREIYRMAADMGLAHIGFSEHSPLPAGFSCHLYTGDLGAAFPLYAEDVALLKNMDDGPEALLGMELDWLPSRLSWMRYLVAAYPFDYILGSLHFLDGFSVGNIANWPEDLPREIRFGRFDAYFHEMASLAASGLVQVISHPDFIKLRSWPDFQLWLEDKSSRDAIAHALESMRDHNVAMEISSAGMRQNFQEFYPCPAIMRLARDLGVMPVFGSDAHKPADIASDFARLAEYALSFGFDHSLIYRQREPFELPISL